MERPAEISADDSGGLVERGLVNRGREGSRWMAFKNPQRVLPYMATRFLLRSVFAGRKKCEDGGGMRVSAGKTTLQRPVQEEWPGVDAPAKRA